MEKYLLEICTATNVGYNTKTKVIESKGEAKKAFEKAVDNLIEETISDNDMSEEDANAYRKEVEETKDTYYAFEPTPVAYAQDGTDCEWFVSLFKLEEYMAIQDE